MRKLLFLLSLLLVLAMVSQTVNALSSDEGCTAVIVTGKAAEGGRSILMKNRDVEGTIDQYQMPTFVSNYEGGQYNFTWTDMMGMNGAGLAIGNTLQHDDSTHPALKNCKSYPGSHTDKVEVMKYVLSHFNDVEQAVTWILNNAKTVDCYALIGQNSDKGAFIFVDNDCKTVVWVNNSYNATANSWVPDNSYGARGKRAMTLLNQYYGEKNYISLKDVMQQISRDQQDREITNNGCYNYSYVDSTELISRDMTSANMIAISGNKTYNGALNMLWFNFGENSQIGLFLPIMPAAVNSYSGIPSIFTTGKGLGGLVEVKRNYATDGCKNSQFNGTRVRQIHGYSFPAEEYSLNKYNELMLSMPGGLTDSQLKSRLKSYVDDAIFFENKTYVEEKLICTPKTCAALVKNCGSWSDGCGGTLNCGTCTSPKTCNANGQCVCTPATCASLGKSCGSWNDGCGGTLNCGGTCKELVGYWKFDEGTGSTTSDSSGKGDTGTLTNGPVWTSGKVGNALKFDGVNDYVNISHGSSLDIKSEITIEAWIYLNSWSSSYPRIVSKEASTVAAPFALELDNSGKRAMFCLDTGTGEKCVNSGNNTVSTKQWYYIVGTWNGTHSRIYVNSQLKSTIALTGTMGINNNYVLIGNNPSKIRQFNGTIDEVKIYNYALGQSDVQTNYNKILMPAYTLPYSLGVLVTITSFIFVILILCLFLVILFALKKYKII